MSPRTLILKKDKEFSLLRGHPWIYREAVKEPPPDLAMGEEVILRSHKGFDLGCGYVDPDSPILVRRVEGAANADLRARLCDRIAAAVALRRSLFDEKTTNAWRAINGEGDGIPGLVVDRYGTALSLQIYSLGLEPYLDIIVTALRKALPEVTLIRRRDQVRRARTAAGSSHGHAFDPHSRLSKTNETSDRSRKTGKDQKNTEDHDALLLGRTMPPFVAFSENGMKFRADLVGGQKTGFFLDQRDNRDLIRRVARGRRCANVCGYTGAFTVAALAGGAKSCVTVDIAEPALREAEKIIQLNGFAAAKHDFITADMFKFLENTKNGPYDLLIVDPPSMAKSRRDVPLALKAYTRLNRLAFSRVAPGGLLFTASCSAQVGRDDFISAVTDALRSTGRFARFLVESHHAPDHPIAVGHPEGRYLHGLLIEVGP
ncbi:MAG: class I SAM-dependent rRNA methyltransferase [Candidatus Riflebacteria bacterium]|nr:class I SAM-dependent rRNA methyltransferase [Candidatus Riflebacteria bacterium]